MPNKRTIVVLDATEWIASRLLRSSTGAALLYAVRHIPARILLPEATERELIQGSVREGQEAVRKINQGFSTIQTLLGKRPDYELPDEEAFASSAELRLAELREHLLQLPLTIGQSRRALGRVVAKSPPSDRTEQFRDALLWEAIAQAGSGARILFASHDTDFFAGHDLKQGLAGCLLGEITNNGGEIRAFADLAGLVSAAQEEVPPPEYAKLATAISTAALPELHAYAARSSLAIGSVAGYSVRAFLTEISDELALSFELSFRVLLTQETDERIAPDSTFRVSGNCFYNLAREEAHDIALEAIRAIDARGDAIPGTGTVYLRTDDALHGTRWLPYKLRAQLGEADAS